MMIRAVALSLSSVTWMPLVSAQEAKSTFEPVVVIWAAGLETAAVCLGKKHWFFSVIPDELEPEDLQSPQLRQEDVTVPVEVIHIDHEQRLCLLECTSGKIACEPVTLSSTVGVSPGQMLRCQSEDGTCRTTVAGKDFSYLGAPLPMPRLRVRVEKEKQFCHPGMPLFNQAGQLEGVLTNQVLSSSSEAYAIPASQLRKLIEDFDRYHRSGKVWVGLVFHDDTATPEVLDVRPDSPASEAGVRVGDVVLKLNQTSIDDLDKLTESIHELPAGKKVALTVLRGLEQHTLDLVPEFAVSDSEE